MPFAAVIAILVVAITFGGGGSKYGLANFLVQLVALIALAMHREAFLGFWQSAPFALKALVGLSILLPLAFLIPLPPGIWTALPGRELVVQSFDLIGSETPSWAPASVEPSRTLLALTALIIPLAVLTIGWNTRRDTLVTAGWILVALGLANLAIGIPQVLSNSEVGVLFPENPMPGVLFGTFANRNSAGLFLVAMLSLASLLPAHPRFGAAAIGIRIAVCVLLILAIILTRSRTAIVLMALPLGLAALRFVALRARPGASRVSSSPNRIWLAIIPAVLAVGIVGTIGVAAPGRLGEVVERFDADGDARTYIWDDAVYSAERYWPVGSGMGSFDDVFQIDESLENMTLRKAGRAHNDYLEVAIEAGLPGLVLIAGWLALIAWLSWRARASSDRWIAWSGAAILLSIALQSITDYPLRNLSMMAVAAYALLILARFGTSRRSKKP